MSGAALLIGYGAIGREVVRRLAIDPEPCLTQVLVRPSRQAAVQAELGEKIRVVTSVDAVERRPDFVLECASHEAVAEFGEAILKSGIDFGVVSIGALSDQGLYDRLAAAAAMGKAQMSIVPGAIAGIDALSAAREGHLDEVVYTSRKPPLSWTGTPADREFDLEAITAPTVVFTGTARDAARLYPKNANVAATVALAGLGFDGTRVTLVADPAAAGNTHEIEARGAFGHLKMSVVAQPLADNPKSSALTALSAVRALKNRVRRICI